jgi:hypothetical protein
VSMKPTRATDGRLELHNAGERDNLPKCQGPVEHQRAAGRSEATCLDLTGRNTPRRSVMISDAASLLSSSRQLAYCAFPSGSSRRQQWAVRRNVPPLRSVPTPGARGCLMARWESEVLAEMPTGGTPAILRFRGDSSQLLGILGRSCLDQP